MEIIIEKLNPLGLVKTKRNVKLPKGRLLITIGDKKILVKNMETISVDTVEPNLKSIQKNFLDNM
jgi:hypothetical protein